MVSIPTTAIILCTKRAVKNGKYPVQLRITYKSKWRTYGLGYYLSEKEFEKVNELKPKPEYKKLKLKFAETEKKATDLLNSFPLISDPKQLFKKFKNHFFSSNNNPLNIYEAFEKYISMLNNEKRLGTADSYIATKRKLEKFKENLTLQDITPAFLESFENWMLEKNKSVTTIGIYARNIRTILNNAIREGIIEQNAYPFGKEKYQIPASNNLKKALKITEIEKIFKFEPTSNNEDFAKDIWIFSYLVNGANINDIARLKYKNIDGDWVSFVRQKTKRTTKNKQVKIHAVLTTLGKQIIKKWGTWPINPENYIFQIITNGLSPEQERAKIKQTIKNINKHMKRIAIVCGIDKNITTYWARHSHSTILYHNGVPLKEISENLGHQSLKTTEIYIASFEDEEKKKYIENLTNFNIK